MAVRSRRKHTLCVSLFIMLCTTVARATPIPTPGAHRSEMQAVLINMHTRAENQPPRAVGESHLFPTVRAKNDNRPQIRQRQAPQPSIKNSSPPSQSAPQWIEPFDSVEVKAVGDDGATRVSDKAVADPKLSGDGYLVGQGADADNTGVILAAVPTFAVIALFALIYWWYKRCHSRIQDDVKAGVPREDWTGTPLRQYGADSLGNKFAADKLELAFFGMRKTPSRQEQLKLAFGSATDISFPQQAATKEMTRYGMRPESAQDLAISEFILPEPRPLSDIALGRLPHEPDDRSKLEQIFAGKRTMGLKNDPLTLELITQLQ
ncbi:hypothetical protein DFJ77DRAFT_507400 [Powellomyces hirtus]|nr:hypothetical protein DFJ77DRAFT_507400 [Powellomyces hirtus]